MKVRPVGPDSVLVCEGVDGPGGASAEHFVPQLVDGERWGNDVTLTGREAHVAIHVWAGKRQERKVATAVMQLGAWKNATCITLEKNWHNYITI